MDFFIKGKHWQLFLLLCGVPIAFQIIFMASVFSAISSGNPEGVIGNTFVWMPVMMVVFMTAFFVWFYTLGTRLHARLPQGVNLKINLFRLFLLLPAIYIMVLMAGMFSFFNGIINTGPSDPAFNPASIAGIMSIVFPLHLLCMFGMFYCLRFNAKALKSVELGRMAKFSDYVGEFFLLWYFPVGLWILQPRINKIFDSAVEESDYAAINQIH